LQKDKKEKTKVEKEKALVQKLQAKFDAARNMKNARSGPVHLTEVIDGDGWLGCRIFEMSTPCTVDQAQVCMLETFCEICCSIYCMSVKSSKQPLIAVWWSHR
jgi:hypothetical protein